MTTTIISHDIQSLVQADKIDDNYTVKRKILWGPDGTGNDVTLDTPLPVQGTFTATNPSIGLNGDPIPTSTTQVGGEDPSGNLTTLKFDNLGSLFVNTSGSFSVQVLRPIFNEVPAIPINFETTINTYTAPLGKTSYLLSILNSGDNRGQFQIYNNAILFDKQYTNVTTLSALFDYKTNVSSVPGYVIPVGNTITVTAINAGTSSGAYNSRFLILEVT